MFGAKVERHDFLSFDPRSVEAHENKRIDSIKEEELQKYLVYLPQLLMLRPELLRQVDSPSMVYISAKSRLCQLLKRLFHSKNRFVLICLLKVAVALRLAAELHPNEEDELLRESANVEAMIVRVLQFRTLDDPKIAMTLLLPSMSAFASLHSRYDFAANILQSKEFLGMCLKHGIKAPFGCTSVLHPVWQLLHGYSIDGKNAKVLKVPLVEMRPGATLRWFELFWNPRSSPMLMFFLEGVSKLVLLGFVANVSIFIYGADDVSGYKGTKREQALVVMMFASILYEVGQFFDLRVKASSYLDAMSLYFDEVWNRLDVCGDLLILVWAVLLLFPEHSDLGRIFLALSAIPLSFALFQYMFIIKSLGRLVLMLIAMVGDFVTFGAVVLISVLGFGITLHGMFHHAKTKQFETFGYMFMFLFGGLMGNMDYASFTNAAAENDWFSSTVMDIGIVVYITFVVFVGIILMNLLIARMASTHNRIEVDSKAEWAYVMVSSSLYLMDFYP